MKILTNFGMDSDSRILCYRKIILAFIKKRISFFYFMGTENLQRLVDHEMEMSDKNNEAKYCQRKVS